ncbi:MAG: hypothetical protein II117_01205, partial [Clostridia bacterium]|nr:hypothetical protein [Clostridia bacterium]
EEKNGHITIEKITTSTPANGSTYALGETISYKITVKNDGNLTITDIEVKDELTGETWTIASLAPGAEEVFTTSYTVTEADVLAGKVVNVATATGTSPDPDKPDVPVVPGEDPEPIEEVNAHLTLAKETTSTPADEKYVLDEVITYKVTATNDGNVTLTNVVVTDELTGDEWTIASLEPGASETFTASYTVTVDDVVAGSVKNVVTATGTDPNGDDAETVPAEVEDTTKKRDDNEITPEPGDESESMDVDSGSITAEYDGQAHTMTATATAEGSTVWYSTDGGATWTTTAPSRTDVGTTEFSIKATNPAYEDVVKTGFTLTVTPKKLTVKIDDQSKYYGEADPEFTYTVEGLVEGEEIPEGTFDIYRDEGEAVGTYTIHGKVAGRMFRTIATMRNVRAARLANILGVNVTRAANTFSVSNYEITFEEGTLEILGYGGQPTETLGDFTLVWLSDLLLAGEGARDEAFKAITAYAAKNEEKAIAILHSGNMVDSFDNEAAWTAAQDALKALAIPFYGVAGTKDVNGDEMSYDAYLAAALNDHTQSFEDGSIWYQELKDQPVLVVGIGHQKLAETDEEKERQDQWLKFVNDAIASHDEFTILVVNDYIDANGELTAFGKLIEENVVANNEDVRLILSGNADGAATWEKTYGERKVVALMYNYVADEENGLGFMRVLAYNSEDQVITVTTINPLTDATAYDEEHPEYDQFVIEGIFDPAE